MWLLYDQIWVSQDVRPPQCVETHRTSVYTEEARLLHLWRGGKLVPHTPHPETVQGAEHHLVFTLISRLDFDQFGLLSYKLILQDFHLRLETAFAL